MYAEDLPDSETTKRWVVGKSLHTHRLGRHHLDDGGVTRFDKLGGVFDGFAGTTIDLLQELGEFAGNVGRMAIEHWSVTGTDLARMVEDDDLGVKRIGAFGWVGLGVASNVTTADFLHGDVLDIEANIVSRKTLGKLLMMHLNGLDFSGDT